MAAKPSATTGWGTGTAIEPSAGKKALGWQANERPPAPYLQWLFKRIEDWLAYLKDGALEGAHSFAGATTFNGAVAATAGVNLNAATSLALPTLKRPIPAAIGYAYGGSPTLFANVWIGAVSAVVHVPIVDIAEGDRINKIRVRHKRGGSTTVLALKRFQYGTLGAAIASLSIASGTSDTEDTVDNGSGANIAHVVEAGYFYVLEVALDHASSQLYGITVESDRPPP